MAKKKAPDEIKDIKDPTLELLNDLKEDREKLVKFFESLLKITDGIQAEAIAKIADSLTKQNVLRATILKSRKSASEKEGPEDMYGEIGSAFELDEGSN